MTVQCPCGFTGDIDECEGAGACDGCVFCPDCELEFDTVTGKRHELGVCCLDATQNGMSPTAAVTDTVTDKELLAEWRGERQEQRSLF